MISCISVCIIIYSATAPKVKRPPSPRKAPPRTPPLLSGYPPATHRADKPRDVPREPLSRPVPRESIRDGMPREDKREGQREPFRETAPSHRTSVHRQDVQRQGSSRGPPSDVPRDASREVRRDTGGQRERDRAQHVPSGGSVVHGSSTAQHREVGSRRIAGGVPSAHGPGTRGNDDARLKSSALPTSAGSRSALPPPPKLSEGASSRSMDSRGSSDARMIGGGLKSDVKAMAKVSSLKHVVSAAC
jgi:hypothetical protein